jgi:UDP-N-acetylmuramate--alanine ligase
MNLNKIHIVYFIGIGGIGMSALARWFAWQGKKVAGYDRTQTPLTDSLIREGIAIHFTDSPELLPQLVADPEITLVVRTPAVPADHKEFNWFIEKGYTIHKRAEVLGEIANAHFNIAVAGTHGKTTTSAMIAHIIKESEKSLTAFLGGITSNYNSNLIVQKADQDDMIVVAEADEFDRSFLRLNPDIAVVTSADADHLDIYGDQQNLTNSFKDFIAKIKPGGKLIIHDAVSHLAHGINNINVLTYGINRGQFFACNSLAKGGFFYFDLHVKHKIVDRIKAGVPGFHNVENAVAAILVALEMGISEKVIKAAIESFSGVKRRFEFIVKREELIFVDDYAHHPVEITAFLTSLRALFPERKLTVIFQPHLYTRTRDFASEFSRSLSIADEVILLDIYPARELPIPGVSSSMLLDDITSDYKILCDRNNLLNVLEKSDLQVLATVGAGDIDALVEPIKNLLNHKYAA